MKIELGNGSASLKEIASYIDLTARPDESGRFPYVNSIATDSREVTEGTLFLGIRGERVDGNDYCKAAIRNGASAVLCEKAPNTGAAIVADDTVLALGRLAKAVKQQCSCRTVAVTGSVGKTTTKDLIYTVLSEKYKTHSSKGNFNSNIGLPMSVLAMPRDTECGVFELGMSAFLEIEYLSHLVNPDVGVITNIGTSHMESLGSQENIAKAKLELINGMREGATLLLNGDDPFLRAARETVLARGIRPLYVSASNDEKISKEADFRAENIRQEIGYTIFDMHFGETVYRDLRLNVMGLHTVYGALFAAAVGVLEGVSEVGIRRGLASFRNAPLRQSIETVAGVTLIEDCYNASPESMRAALDVAKSLVKNQGEGRLVAVLGDMLELGETSSRFHEEVGEYVAKSGAAMLFLFGERATRSLAHGARVGGVCADKIFTWDYADSPEEIAERILSEVRRGDVILIKASRAMRAERIGQILRERLTSY